MTEGGFYSNCGLMLFPPMALIIVGCIIWVHRSRNKDLGKNRRVAYGIIESLYRSIFIDNMVFFFFGMVRTLPCRSVKAALGLGAAVTFVMVMTVPLNYLL